MRTPKVICLMVLVCICLSSSGFPSTIQDTISYPPKPPETTTEEMVNAGKGLVKETTELSKAMIIGVKEDGGIVATIRKHTKFYGSIAIFGILTLLWLKNRRR
ncbi:MAG: hypothetical protein NTU98_08270 [Bacteroidetes bacterium]|nr:hypothetical protein [Bacteroidota bacterium]